MKVFVDLDSLQLIEGAGFRTPAGPLRFKRGDAVRMEVVFLAGGTTPASIGDPATLELRFGVKPRNRYDMGYLVHGTDWIIPVEDTEDLVYGCSPDFNTVELNSALGVGSPTGSELAEIILMGEITWREGTGQPTSTRTFLVVVENDVNRGTEGVPTNADPAYPAAGNIVTMTTLGNHAVRYDVEQELTPEQKARARDNIGAGTGGGGVALDGDNIWTGHNAFVGVNITTAHAGWAGDLYYKNQDTGDVDAIPVGAEGQILTVVAGLPAWTDPPGGTVSGTIGTVVFDGMTQTLTPDPWHPPDFDAYTEALHVTVTINADTNMSMNLTLSLQEPGLACFILSQALADAPTLYIGSNGMDGIMLNGFMMDTYMLRAGDTYTFKLEVPPASMVGYMPGDPYVFYAPFGPLFGVPINATAIYTILPK